MIRSVGNKRLFLTDYEYLAYKKIVESIDKTEFNGSFDSDINGTILSVISYENVDSRVNQFLFNIMLNQRVNSSYLISKNQEKRINAMNDKIIILEEKVDLLETMAGME